MALVIIYAVLSHFDFVAKYTVKNLNKDFTNTGRGHSASKRAHFRHFQSVLETVFFVFSVNLIHILILFWPLWFLSRKYGRFMAIVIFWKPKNEQNWPQIWNNRKRRISGSQVPNMIGFYWTHPKLKILDQKCQLVLKKTWFLSHFVMKKYQILSFFLGYMPETLRNYSSVTFHAINIQNRHQV